MDKQVRLCTRSGKSVRGDWSARKRWFLACSGLVSLIWFLVRVIPKPSRVSYPCQRAAAPLAAGFVTWVAGAVFPAALMHRAHAFSLAGKRRLSGAFVAVALVASVVWLAHQSGPTLQAWGGS